MSKRIPFREHLLVDGYNLAHAWPEVRESLERNIDTAVEFLSSELRWVHDTREVRVSIVLDGKGEDIELVRPFKEATFSLVYSPASLSADGVIEQLASSSEDPQSIFVCTGDQAILDGIEAAGANAVSSELLLSWLRAAKKMSRRKLEKPDSSSENAFGNRIPL